MRNAAPLLSRHRRLPAGRPSAASSFVPEPRATPSRHRRTARRPLLEPHVFARATTCSLTCGSC